MHEFNQIMKMVLDERKNSYKSLRTAAWELNISKRIERYFQHKFVENIGEYELNHFFAYVRHKDDGSLYSDKYLKEVYGLTKATMKKALLKGYINIDPFDYGLKRPKGKPTQAKQRYVDSRELEMLLACCKNHRQFQFIIPMLLFTGMRIGELLGLYWSDIDFDNNIINISRSVSDNFIELPTGEIVKSGVRIDSPKTAHSIRQLPVDRRVTDLLRKLLLFRDKPENAAWKKKITENNNSHFVFLNENGKVMNYTTLYDSLMDFLNKNGFGKSKILFHMLRHNYATDLLAAGVDITIISQLLGHASIETTVNTYISDQNIDIKMGAIKKQSRYLQKYD